MSLFVFWLLYMRSTFPGTELDFLLKLTRQPKNNPPQDRKREREGSEWKQGGDREGWKEGTRREKCEMDMVGKKKTVKRITKRSTANRKTEMFRQTVLQLHVNLWAFLFPAATPFNSPSAATSRPMHNSARCSQTRYSGFWRYSLVVCEAAEKQSEAVVLQENEAFPSYSCGNKWRRSSVSGLRLSRRGSWVGSYDLLCPEKWDVVAQLFYTFWSPISTERHSLIWYGTVRN